MTIKERDSCINTIEILRRLAFNVHGVIDAIDAENCEKIIEMLRQPEPHWIPCSERLPEEDEDVLVCSEDGDIDVACWMPEQWTDEPHIEWWSGEYRVDAVAWMPLPKPYGGDNK